MLEIVAENVIEVIALFRVNVAEPDDAGRAPPVLRVGFVGGFSCEFVRFAVKVVCAYALASAIRTTKGIKQTFSRSIRFTCLSGGAISIQQVQSGALGSVAAK